MATFSMTGVHAVMAQADVAVTIDGNVFTMPAQVAFTTSAASIDVPAGTILAVMRNPTSPNGKILQVFSADEVVTL